MPDSDIQAPLKDPVGDPVADPLRDPIVDPLSGAQAENPAGGWSVQPG